MSRTYVKINNRPKIQRNEDLQNNVNTVINVLCHKENKEITDELNKINDISLYQLNKANELKTAIGNLKTVKDAKCKEQESCQVKISSEFGKMEKKFKETQVSFSQDFSRHINDYKTRVNFYGSKLEENSRKKFIQLLKKETEKIRNENNNTISFNFQIQMKDLSE